MRKFLLALALVAIATTAANAQLNLFYDVREKTDILTPAAPYLASDSLCTYVAYGYGQNYPLYNSGGRGDGQTVWISPWMKDFCDYTGNPLYPDGIPENEHSFYAGIDWSKADFNLYAEYAAPAGTVVSSIGVTQEIPAAAFTANAGDFYLESVSVTPQNTTMWDGYNFVGADDSISMKMVQVPVAAGPVFDTDAAFLNPGDFEKIATFEVQAAEMAYGEDPEVKSYEVTLKVNELLCTHVAYPTPAGNLSMNLGYYQGAEDPLTGGNTGSDLNATSANADMIITVVQKGDFDLDGAACTANDDFAYYDIVTFYNGVDNCNAFEMYLADFDLDGLPATGIDDYEYYKHATFPAGPPL